MPRSGVMLAYPLEAKRIESWGYPVFVQPKLNGRRCVAIKERFEAEEKKSLLLSSQRNIIVSVPHINTELSFWNTSIMLDGELYKHGMDKQDIDSRTARTVNLHPDHKSIEYHIFDVKDLIHTQGERTRALAALKESVDLLNLEYIKFVPTYNVIDWDSLMFHQELFLSQGYEGIIVRNPKAMYIERRTYDLLKHKPTEQDKYEIVGYEQLLSKVCPICYRTPSYCTDNIEEKDLIEAPKDMLGSFICKDIRGTHFNVGSGKMLTKESRREFWEGRGNLVGRILVVKYERLTKDKGIPVSGVAMEIV